MRLRCRQLEELGLVFEAVELLIRASARGVWFVGRRVVRYALRNR
jgi:hypothetical protein